MLRAIRFLAFSSFLALFSMQALSADFGDPGDPIDLVVGHPCCYTEVWSVMALKGENMWEKYLPDGSTVKFDIGLQGSTIFNNMLAGKAQIGYIGDLPALVATTKEKIKDLRIVAATGVAYDQCNILLVSSDAPKFDSPGDGVQWLSDKRFSVPKGACSDKFTKTLFAKADVEPAQYLNQNVEVITSSFRAKKIDGAAIWEPIAARLVNDGLARRLLTGFNYDLKDSSYIVMSAELIEQRPDIVEAWLNAELDAQLYMTKAENADSIVEIVKQNTTGFSEKTIWDSLYRRYPKSEGGGVDSRLMFPFAFTEEVMGLINSNMEFLYQSKNVRSPELRQSAIMPEFAARVLEARSLSSPIGEVPTLPESDSPKQ